MNPEKMTPEELEQFIHRELRALPPRKAPAGFEARFQARLEAHQTAAALSPEQLEQLVHRELRALPPRRAPRTLEARVMTAIEQRATVAWYHRSWSYWPAAVRAAFLMIATGLTGAAITAVTLMSRGLDAGAAVQEAGSRFPLATQLYATGAWTVDFLGRMAANIPSLWLYGGLAAVAALYATFFGLGAAAYRTLYRSN